jgi:hypothetical protein
VKGSPYHNRRHLEDLVHVFQRQGHIPQGGLIGQLFGTLRKENHICDALGRGCTEPVLPPDLGAPGT